jgi:2-oxoglutarate dehydrogenase E1 component
VLLLPHGFEGQGPEHSSARLERFLTIAAEDNIQVACPSTPAQYFHLLRRQVLRPWRKPLVVMTPKSLLRHPRAVSDLEELTPRRGGFQRIIPDPAVQPDAVQRIILCNGKIFHELHQQREELKRTAVALVRIEQLYPLADETLAGALAPYADGTPVYWVQEEPENMGAWRYLRVRFGESLLERHPFIGIYRRSAASPATGSSSSHKLEQKELLERALSEPRP